MKTVDMYLPAEELEKSVLRQGDILKAVHVLGAINLNSILYSSTAKNPPTSWTIPNPPKFADAMVISHSCEIAPENGVKITSVILAPIRDINTATEPSKVKELIETNLIDKTGAKASYLKYFHLAPNPLLEFSSGAVADFSKCFSVRRQCYTLLLERKIAQLTPEVRKSMAFKVALYFYREDI